MSKKQKIQKNKDIPEKKIEKDYSAILNASEKKLELSQQHNSVEGNLDPINWNNSDNNSSTLIDLEKKYHKEYVTYMREEFNFKIIKMFFNFIFTTKCIPQETKDNQPFLKTFLKIIKNLLMNEFELATMAYLLEEKLLWVQNQEPDDMWYRLYYICLKAKELTSSDEIFEILMNYLDAKNKGFKEKYSKWEKNEYYTKKCKDNDLKIDKINEYYKALMISNDLTQNQGKFINYNEVVNKIMEFSNKESRVKKIKKEKKTNKDEDEDKDKDNERQNENGINFPQTSFNQHQILFQPSQKIINQSNNNNNLYLFNSNIGMSANYDFYSSNIHYINNLFPQRNTSFMNYNGSLNLMPQSSVRSNMSMNSYNDQNNQ